MLTGLQKELIAIETIQALHSQVREIAEVVNPKQAKVLGNAFLKSLVDNKLGEISLSSWMHGLNTSLGQSFFENVAHILCNGTKEEFTARKKRLLKLSPAQKLEIAHAITDLSNATSSPDALVDSKEISDALEAVEEALEDATGFTADVFFEDADQVVCVELKTVKPNKGVFKVEKQKILEAKAALHRAYPNKKVEFFIGFPFDPLSAAPTGYDKQRFMDYSVDFRKYFSESEFLLSAELWDYLSGTMQTMETILEIINSIATVDFMEHFEFLRQKENAVSRRTEYINLLKKWFLFREVILVENRESIQAKIDGNKRLVRVFNQGVFIIKSEDDKCKAEYNETRHAVLSEFA
jgi:hypothetical protein